MLRNVDLTLQLMGQERDVISFVVEEVIRLTWGGGRSRGSQTNCEAQVRDDDLLDQGRVGTQD